MLRPSSLGDDLDLGRRAPPARRPGRGSACPSSGWAISRPRNMIVTLTLWPSPRNCSTLRVLVSKSPAPILGRYFISLIDDVGALAPRLLGLLRCLVLVLAVVHDPADRRVGLGGHLDEVEVELTGDGECLGQRLDADLRAVGSDEADLAGSDAIVDPGLVGRRRGYCRSLHSKGCSSRVANTAIRKSRRRRTKSHPCRACDRGSGSTSVDHGAPDDRWRSGGRVGRCHTVRSPTTWQHCPLSEFSCPVRVTQVSSLWTPGGEHPVDPEPDAASSGALEAIAGVSTTMPEIRGRGRDAGRDRRGPPPARPGAA